MRKLLLFILFLNILPIFVYAQKFVPTLNATSAILIDYEDGNILFEKESSKIVAPASMTKLVTIWTALEKCAEKKYTLNTKFQVPESADFRNAPPKSSLMFLQAGQVVTLRDLITGLAIPSGNEAAVALALASSGSVKNFIEDMNSLMKKEGFNNCIFFDTSGYDEKNQITAKEFAFCCRKLIKKFPEILEFSSIPSFSYPKKENYISTNSVPVHGTITQQNHNELIDAYKEVDGLKTGYINRSGNNVSLTAKHGNTRLIAVLCGIYDEDGMKRSIKRVTDGSAILTYGFCNWETFSFSPQDLVIGVKKSFPKKITAKNSAPILLTLPVNYKDKVELKYVLNNNLTAPIKAGSEIGKYELYINDEFRKSSALLADVDCVYETFWDKLKRIF